MAVTETQQPAEGTSALDAVEAEALGLQVEADASQAKAEESRRKAETENASADLLQWLRLGRMTAAPAFPWWPEFGQVWNDKQLQAIAEAGAAVMQRHGMTLGAVMERWGPYVALVAATAGPSLATYTAIKAHRAQQAGRPADEAGAGQVDQ